MPHEMPVAVVTGASRGLRSAFAEVLAEEGYALALRARNQSDLQQVGQNQPVEAIAAFLDVSNPASVKTVYNEVIKQFRRLDVLVNNAGTAIFKCLEDFEPTEFDRLSAVNVKGTWLVTKAFVPQLTPNQGLVLMVSSDVSVRTFPTGDLTPLPSLH